MTIFFFRTAIDFVLANLGQKNCAFWYAPGLQSYKYIDTVITIDSLAIEEDIFEAFAADYPDIISRYKFTLFTGKRKMDLIDKKICYYASNDTIMSSFKSIIAQYDRKNYAVYCRSTENAIDVANKFNIPAQETIASVPNLSDYSVLILGNDWGIFEQKVNNDFHSRNINTVCIQESSIDFNPKDKRMRYCSFPIFQGVATLSNFDVGGLLCAVIGNPRFEGLKPQRQISNDKALINVNFTYNIFEGIREEWTQDVLNACREENIEYVISQHPRDKGNFEGYNVIKSNALLVHDSIKESSVLISRFSALLTEAVALGRPAIYYNPHKENMHYNFEQDDKMFFVAENKEQLKTALRAVKVSNADNLLGSTFLEKHIGNSIEGKSSYYIKLAIDDIRTFPVLKHTTLFRRLKSKLRYHKAMMKIK